MFIFFVQCVSCNLCYESRLMSIVHLCNMHYNACNLCDLLFHMRPLTQLNVDYNQCNLCNKLLNLMTWMNKRTFLVPLNCIFLHLIFFDINMNAMLENLVIIDVENESCASTPKNPKKGCKLSALTPLWILAKLRH